jgi:hypothetical protein
MSLSRSEINPLGVLGLRKLTFIPEHFSKLSVDRATDTKLLEHWVSYNLNSRYAIIRRIALDQNKKMIEVVEIGIEDPRELTMLSLGCPHLHKK